MSRIYLIGYPCQNKTKYGEYLSKALNYPLYDLDKEFQNKYEISPKECIKEFGEGIFRIWETELLEDIIETKEKHCIINCGEGTPCYFNNMNKILYDGEVLYLELPWYKLYWNILKDMKTITNKRFFISSFKLYKKRKEIYEKAHRTLKFNEDIPI